MRILAGRPALHPSRPALHPARAGWRVPAKARAAALQKTLQTEAERVTRLATANGEATAIRALYAEYKLRPDVYRYRKRLETLEAVLEKDPHYIVDSRIERDGGAVWILNN